MATPATAPSSSSFVEAGTAAAAAAAAPSSSSVPRMRVLSPKPLLDEELVLAACARRGIKPVHAYKMWRALLQNGITEVDKVPNLPKSILDMIKEEEFVLTTSHVVRREDSADGSTTKLLIELQDGHRIETVIMRYGCVQLSTFPEEKQRVTGDGEVTFKSNKRATACLSSQVGCAMGCTFCATGTMGLMENLRAGEILEQLYHAHRTVEPIRNVVFMGMGEPLDNYDAVISAFRGMTDVRRFTLAPNRISVSTVGVVPRLRRLAHDAPGVSLALSLHAPTQSLRSQIVPSSKAWHIDRIMAATDEFLETQQVQKPGRNPSVCIEYVLIQGVNSSVDVANTLGEMLANRPCLLNVIPYNPTDVPHDYAPPGREETHAFVDAVREHGVKVILRQTMGQDIGGACGQLVVRNQRSSNSSCSSGSGSGGGGGGGGGNGSGGCGSSDIEDLTAMGKSLKSNNNNNNNKTKERDSTPTPTTATAAAAAPTAAAAAADTNTATTKEKTSGKTAASVAETVEANTFASTSKAEAKWSLLNYAVAALALTGLARIAWRRLQQ